MTQRQKDNLLNTFPLTAVLSFSKKKFNQWESLRWEMLGKWHGDNTTTVYPCMTGEHWHNKKRYTL